MLVRNVEPRLIIVAGVFIAPDAVVDVDEKAGGLVSLLERGVLEELVFETFMEAKPKNNEQKDNKPKSEDTGEIKDEAEK